MASKSGFTSMAAISADKEIPEIGVGMLGYAFMGKAHTHALKTIPHMIYPPPAIPKLISICGRNEKAVSAAARRYGYETYHTDWRKMLEDDRIQLFDNGANNDIHAEPCIQAAEAGKHIICEKPLARNAEESKQMLDAVIKAGVKHMTAFNYRFVPALRQAKELIDQGKLGRIYHFRAVYLQEWAMPQYELPYIWRMNKQSAGSGSLGDLGAHLIDLAHFLIGDVESVSALTRTFVNERKELQRPGKGKVDVDDAFVSTIAFTNGAIGTLEATRFAAGRKNHQVIEINGEKGSIEFNLERMNELNVYWIDDDPRETQGFHNTLISESFHPWWKHWWPHGHIIGWEHTFIHELAHFLDCIVNDRDVAPYGATFEDGYRAAVVCDAVLESADAQRVVDVRYTQ
jgi:predicted dehydrogenase